MPLRPLARNSGSAGHGTLVLITTVESSGASMLAMFWNTKMNRSGARPVFAVASASPRLTSRFSFTISALSGVPSWNVTPWRSLMVSDVYSGFQLDDSARYGVALKSLSNTNRESYTAFATWMLPAASCAVGRQ